MMAAPTINQSVSKTGEGVDQVMDGPCPEKWKNYNA
jgi:hypothetical protein